MNILNIWQQSILSAWTNFFTKALLFLPIFLGAIIIFVIGLYLSSWLQKGIEHLLKAIKFSKLTSESGLDKFLKKADLEVDTIGLISQAVKWFVILVFFTASTNILGLTAISTIVNNLLSFVPKIVTATLIIAVGMFVANLTEGLVKGALATVDHKQAKNLSQIARWIVLFISIMAGINELEVAQNLITIFFQGLTWTITLSVGLALGLGGKDVISQILKDWYEKLKK